MNNSKQTINSNKVSSQEHCTAFCPKCKSDLYLMEKECMCKNKKCNWTCGGCKET